MSYKTTIGLEIHIELDTATKMFCSCPNDPYESHPNVNICPICLGHPGTLPTINKKAVEKVLLVGYALDADLVNETHFDRKSYFYPDLPKGFQISQYDKPLVKNGQLKGVSIKRIHLEEDTGSLSHSSGNYSLVDYNRAGMPLAELVTEPDINSSEEALEFAKELQLIFRYLNVSSADMERGQMRVEANVSVSEDEGNLGTKVELKNLNSFKAVREAIKYEVERQKEKLEKGESITQQTRGWDEQKGVTVAQREKEEAHGYRYFPEPDLPTFKVEDEWNTQDLEEKTPELPQEKRHRFRDQFNLDKEDINFLVQDKTQADFFENAVSELKNFDSSYDEKVLFNYLKSDLRGILKERAANFEDLLVSPEDFGHLIALVESGEISSKIAKDMLEEMFETGKDPETLQEEGQYELIGSESDLEPLAKKVIEENPDPVSDYLDGKRAAVQALVGKIMSETNGQADPELAKSVLEEELSKIED
ncbi:MAG: Asp-tRNA(Asn)/Glu-tRNA(Gln) amidotransferase subunit GatB [Candidatus Magasanikbacteria bacterium]